jgi:hypothetical protein
MKKITVKFGNDFDTNGSHIKDVNVIGKFNRITYVLVPEDGQLSLGWATAKDSISSRHIAYECTTVSESYNTYKEVLDRMIEDIKNWINYPDYDVTKIRRRIEDSLRKSTDTIKLLKVAELLDVKV